MTPYILGIILSYCSEADDTKYIIDAIGDDGKVAELYYCRDPKFASRFQNLRVLDLRGFTGDLAPLRGMPLQTLNLWSFTGDLAPLRGMPIQTLDLQRFTGDLAPLRGMKIPRLYIRKNQ